MSSALRHVGIGVNPDLLQDVGADVKGELAPVLVRTLRVDGPDLVTLPLQAVGSDAAYLRLVRAVIVDPLIRPAYYHFWEHTPTSE